MALDNFLKFPPQIPQRVPSEKCSSIPPKISTWILKKIFQKFLQGVFPRYHAQIHLSILSENHEKFPTNHLNNFPERKRFSAEQFSSYDLFHNFSYRGFLQEILQVPICMLPRGIYPMTAPTTLFPRDHLKQSFWKKTKDFPGFFQGFHGNYFKNSFRTLLQKFFQGFLWKFIKWLKRVFFKNSSRKSLNNCSEDFRNDFI